MPTPLLNKQLLRLRRRLGDIFTQDRVEIQEATIGTLDGEIWRASEIVDIYNSAVVDYLTYIVSTVSLNRLYEHIPGYIKYLTSVTITSGKLELSELKPTPLKFISIGVRTNNPIKARSFVEIPPNEFIDTKSGRFPNRNPSELELYYTVLMYGQNETIFTIPSINFTDVEFVYVCRHTDLVVNGITDLAGINPDGLRKILDFGEAEAIKQKYGTVLNKIPASSNNGTK